MCVQVINIHAFDGVSFEFTSFDSFTCINLPLQIYIIIYIIIVLKIPIIELASRFSLLREHRHVTQTAALYIII